MRELAVRLAWRNFSEYYAREMAWAIRDRYRTLVTYGDLDWGPFDVVYCFFASSHDLDCKLEKVAQSVWEPTESGKRAGTVLAHTTRAYERTRRRYGGRARYLPWGVNPGYFQPQPFPGRGEVVVGWAGVPGLGRKRFSELRDAVALLDGAVFKPNECVVRRGIVKGPYASVEDMPWYYRTIDVYACASHSEGFGFPLLEAAACGRGIVTFDVGCARDLLETGAGVVIVESFDEMREAIVSVDWREMGRRSAEAVAEHWTWERVGPLWAHVLDGVGT